MPLYYTDDIDNFKLISSNNNYNEKLNEYDQAFYLILSKLSPIYYNYRRNPDDTLYANKIEEINQGLQNSKIDLFLLSNELENINLDIKEKTKLLNEKIDSININNKEISNEYKSLEESSNSSKGRLNEHKQIYKFKIFDIFFILVLIIYVLYNLYSISNINKYNMFDNISKTVNIQNIQNIGDKIKSNIVNIPKNITNNQKSQNIQKDFDDLFKKRLY